MRAHAVIIALLGFLPQVRSRRQTANPDSVCLPSHRRNPIGDENNIAVGSSDGKVVHLIVSKFDWKSIVWFPTTEGVEM